MFGQVLVGPPGCGKSTYCYGLSQFFDAIERPYSIINLDPANDNIPYKPNIDISELISLEKVQDELQLGPNGGLLYCLEYLECNFEWLRDRILEQKDRYLIFDCPGQVELFTVHHSLKNIIKRLEKMDIRICVVNLMDSHYCVDLSRFVSMLMVSLKTMLQLDCPLVNVLSKVDLMKSYGKLDFNLDYYCQVQDLTYLLDRLDSDPFTARYKKLNSVICELIQEFGLVGYMTLCIQDKDSVLHLVRAIDKANGYVYGGLEVGNESIFEVADRWDQWEHYIQEVQEKYLAEEQDISPIEFLGDIHEQ